MNVQIPIPKDNWRAWCQIRAAAKAARQAAAEGFGPRTSAEAAAYHLVHADPVIRSRAAAVCAAQQAKHHTLIDVGHLHRLLDDHDRFDQEMRTRRPIRRRASFPTRRESLPVEQARAVPIVEVCGRLGLELRRAGRDYEMQCPSCGRESRSRNCRVYPRSRTGAGRFYCFSCQAKGDTIALVMLVRGVDFAEAVRQVAA